jgi:hypothetical protein
LGFAIGFLGLHWAWHQSIRLIFVLYAFPFSCSSKDKSNEVTLLLDFGCVIGVLVILDADNRLFAI